MIQKLNEVKIWIKYVLFLFGNKFLLSLFILTAVIYNSYITETR